MLINILFNDMNTYPSRKKLIYTLQYIIIVKHTVEHRSETIYYDL